MLPPYLKAVYQNLKDKGFNARTSDEDELLKELEWLGALGGMDEAILEAQRGQQIKESRHAAKGILIDQGKCPCCGH